MFTVELAGHGVVRDPGFPPYPVFVISVQQPIQSWTCYRRYSSFKSLSEHLQTLAMGGSLPSCPPMNDDMLVASVEQLGRARVLLQQWLHQTLLHPGVKESAVLRNFLCANANMPPPRLDITWAKSYCPSLDEMEMDELFDRHLEEREGADSDDDSVCGGSGGGSSGLPPGGGGSGSGGQPNCIGGAAARSGGSARKSGLGGGIGRVDMVGMEDNDDDAFGAIVVDGGGLEGPSSVSMASSLAPDGAGGDRGSGGITNGGGYPGSSAYYYDAALDMPNEDDIASSVPIEITFKDPAEFKATHGVARGQSAAAAATAAPALAGSAAPGLPAAGGAAGGARPEKEAKVGLDSFKIIRVIGKGSFGKVFLVREKTAGDIYAMKVLRKDNIIRRNQVEHTRTERNVLGYVKHPFIVGLNMAFQTPAKLFFVLDYCAGGELFFHLGKLGKFSEPRAKFYTAEITLALDHVHKLDIVYRDLKPENVLLDGQGHIRLTDFGLSKEGITNNTSGAHSFCGTPEYLAPEILSRQGHGRAVDWWSMGALLYEMLTGLPPFYSQDRERLFEKIRRGQLTYPRYLNEPAQDILHGLLTRDPSRRLGSSHEDAEEIKRHPFFGGTDWPGVLRKEVPVPWEPTVVGSLDTSQFDREFTSMPILSPDSRTDFKLGPHHDNTFEGFTFVDRGHLASAGMRPHPMGTAPSSAASFRPRVVVDHMRGDPERKFLSDRERGLP